MADFSFESMDISLHTADVTGTLLTEKVFLPKSDTGDIEVPKTNAGGKCEIITSTGDIKLTIQ